ncbi:topoisomerase II-associated protein PAT1 [Geopyxis carbonaria]|nr:topoisomerase II-associated protein PAT1 [Geopyxis carbonaria]
MSFFGFDSSLPRDRGHHPSQAPGFGATPDHFAGLSSRTDGDDDDGIDFDDTYDGLGDGLDETDDALNADTFGGGDNSVGKDFDFHGSTAKVADVLNEEQAVYTRSNTKKQPVRSGPGPAHMPKTIPPESRQIPALVPDMSLWGEPSHAATEMGRQEIQPPQPITSGGKKFMSLEEVEAQILAMNQKPPAPQPLQSQIQPQAQMVSSGQPLSHQFQHQLPPHAHTPPVSQLPQFPPHQDTPGFSVQQLPPHLQHMLQQNHGHIPQHLQQAERLAQQQRIQHEEQHQQPIHAANQNRNQYGMTTHMPAHQLQSMPEVERLRFLEEESKRLKRNHKIAQLARFNGLMTPQDKNFIQRIQLQQLVSINNTEDNSNEDFYYIVHSAIRARANPQQPLSQLAQTYLFRNGGRGNRRQDNHLQRMEQQVARAVAAAKARPKASQLVLEGSLGKISFSNVKTPRPMLNIKRPESDQAKPPQKSRADRKSLLKIIENIYDALLELEVHERERSKLPVVQPNQSPHETHVQWEMKRDQLAQKLYVEMKVLEPIDQSSNISHPFIAILSFSKMKRAIPRIFRHLDPEQRVTVLTIIVVHLDVLDVVRHGIYRPDETQLPSAFREEIDMFSSNVLPPLLSYMYEAPLSIAVGLLQLLLDRVDVRSISKTKIGLAFLTMFFSRAEIVKQSGQADEKELQDWESTYCRFFDKLQGYWMDCFPPSGRFVDDQYVWQFLASMAVGANMQQQQILVASIRDRVLENVQASKVLPQEIGVQKRENVNLFMRAMGLDVDLLG